MSGRLGMTGDNVARGDKLVGRVQAGYEPVAKKNDHSGAAAGAGGVLATGGLLGGGLPGTRPEAARMKQAKEGTRIQRTKHITAATKGGIFGWRKDAHEGFLGDQTADEKKYAGTKTSRVNHYHRGVGSGKIEPEKTIIRHMHRGRMGSNAALVGGGALLVGGGALHHQRKEVAAKREHFGTEATIAAGGTTAALGGGAALTMESQGRKWAKRAEENLKEAERLNPRVGGHTVKTRGRSRVPDVAPRRGKDAITNDKRVLAGRSNKAADAVGRARGAALQHRYFAGVYGTTALKARKVAGAGALIGAAGLGARQVQKGLATPTAGRIPGVGAIVDHRGQIQFLSQLPKVYQGEPQRVLSTVRRPKRKLMRTGNRAVAKVDTTMSEHEAGKLAHRYDTKGPLPKGLTREQKMKAYEARYVAAGGKKGEKWKRRADAGEVQRNVGLAVATGLGAGSLIARHPKIKLRSPKLHNRLEVGSLAGAVHGGAAELYSEHARSRRASYANAPAGIAASALSRMRAYTPEGKS